MDEKLLEYFHKVEKEHWWWEGRRMLVQYLLGNRKHRRMLDIGCGTGETLTFLKNTYACQVFGVDPSIKAVNFAKSRGHKNVFKAKADKLPFKDNYFDAILFLDVLEHIKEDDKAVLEAKRVLKKNGKLIITSPALSFIWSNHDSNQGHYRRYTRHQIRKLAKEADMKVTFISYFNFFLSPPIIAIRLLSRIPVFSGFASYNNSVNYDIVKIGTFNKLLSKIFIKEINLLKLFHYPIGISVASVFNKK